MDPTEGLPLISIITPVRYGGPMLEELIESVATQDYPSIEHVVIDDGSDDGGSTVQILEGHPGLRWWTQPWTGQYAAMNAGLRRARGSIVCFISADDICAPGAIAAAADYLTRYPEADGVYGRAIYIDHEGKRYPVQIPWYRAPLKMMRYLYFIPHCALYMRGRALEAKNLWFDEGLRFCGDLDWMLRMIGGEIKLGYIPHVMALVRVHPGQASQMRAAETPLEKQVVNRRYGVNSGLQWLVTSTLTVRSAVLRLVHALRTTGLGAAIGLVRGWLKRREH